MSWICAGGSTQHGANSLGSCWELCWELSAATQGSLCHRCQLQFTFPSMNTSEGKVFEGSSTQGTCGAASSSCFQSCCIGCRVQEVCCALGSTAVLLPADG